jgi:hypothetical protein
MGDWTNINMNALACLSSLSETSTKANQLLAAHTFRRPAGEENSISRIYHLSDIRNV